MMRTFFFMSIFLGAITITACIENQNVVTTIPTNMNESEQLSHTQFLFTAANANDNYKFTTYSLNLQGEIKPVVDLPLWAGYPILPNGDILLSPYQDVNSPSATSMIIYNQQTKNQKDVELFANPLALYSSPVDNIVAYNIYDSETNLLHFYFVNEEKDEIVQTIRGKALSILGWSKNGNKLFLLWQSQQTGNYDLFYLNTNDFSLNQITNNSDLEILVADSPQNELFIIGIVPKKDEYSFLNIHHEFAKQFYLIDLNRKERILSFDEVLRTASWSPKGEKVALSINGNLCFFDGKTFKRHCPIQELLPLEEYASALLYPASWSADGQFIAFQAINQENACHEIYIYDLMNNALIYPEAYPCLGTPIFSTFNSTEE